MTPEEIRAEAIDRIARARFEAVMTDYPDDHRTPSERRSVADNCRLLAGEAVDALGDLLPTGRSTRTLVYEPQDEVVDDNLHLTAEMDGRESEYAHIAENWRNDGGRVARQRCWTHDWIEDPDA